MTADFSSLFKIHEQTPRQLRIGGALMVVLGAFILAGGILFAWLLMGIPIPAEWLPAGTRAEGVPGEGMSTGGRVAMSIFTAALLAFGLAAISLGLFQLLTGRQQKGLLKFMLVILAGIILAGGIASAISGCQVGRICQ